MALTLRLPDTEADALRTWATLRADPCGRDGYEGLPTKAAAPPHLLARNHSVAERASAPR